MAAPTNAPGTINPSLTLGIDPTSGATAGGDWLSSTINPVFSTFNVDAGQGGSTGGTTAITGLVRDLAVGVAVALLAKWCWTYLARMR